MGLLECASGASAWRGYDYFKGKKVKRLTQLESGVFSAEVEGSQHSTYSVLIDVTHPRKSKCNCPHADGRRVVCKHMIATYFSAFPQEAKKFYDDYVAYQQEEEQREEDIYDRVTDFVEKMTREELCQTLLDLLFDGPEWQYDRFVRENSLDD